MVKIVSWLLSLFTFLQLIKTIIMAVLKVIELMADSDKSWEDATKKAVAKASDTLKNVRSAFVQSQSVTVKEGKVDKFRINLKITFEID